MSLSLIRTRPPRASPLCLVVCDLLFMVGEVKRHLGNLARLILPLVQRHHKERERERGATKVERVGGEEKGERGGVRKGN